MATLAATNTDNALLFVYNEWTIRQQAKVAAFRAAFGVSDKLPIYIDGQQWSFVRIADDAKQPDGPGRIVLRRVQSDAKPVATATPTIRDVATEILTGRKPKSAKAKLADKKAKMVQWWLEQQPKQSTTSDKKEKGINSANGTHNTDG